MIDNVLLLEHFLAVWWWWWWVAHKILLSALGPNPSFFGGLLFNLGVCWDRGLDLDQGLTKEEDLSVSLRLVSEVQNCPCQLSNQGLTLMTASCI